jgi:hypothetical protein
MTVTPASLTWSGVMLSPVPIHPEGVRFTPGQAEEVIAAIGDALADAELTVDELTEALADWTGPWAVERTMWHPRLIHRAGPGRRTGSPVRGTFRERKSTRSRSKVRVVLRGWGNQLQPSRRRTR